jgi:hypothetical protein
VRESCEKSLRESEFTSSGGIVPFVNTVGTDPGEARTGRSFGAEEISRRRINGQDSQGKIREIPLTVRSGRSCEGFNPWRRKNQSPSGFGLSGLTRQEFHTVEIASSDFPI